MRTCTGCQIPKPLIDFSKDRRSPDGLLRICKACTKLKNRASYERHAEKRKADQRERNKHDKEAKSAYNRAYREQHREKLIQHSRDWRAAGGKANRTPESVERQNARKRMLYATDPAYRERAKAYAALFRKKLSQDKRRSDSKRWRAANLDHARKYMRDYYRAFNQTPEGRARQAAMRIKHRAKRQARRTAYYAKRYGKTGTITSGHLNWLHKWQDHCCGYCNKPLEQKETIEHIVPLKREGENNPHNILLVCGFCNSSKQKRLFDSSEWLPENIHMTTRTHSTIGLKQALDMCREEGVPVMPEDVLRGNHRETALRLPNGRRLHVLSSFWMSDRAEPATSLVELHAAHPDDVFTFEYEWTQRPEAMLNVLRAKGGVSESIGARELNIAAPSTDEARAFMDKWHAQGFSGGSWYVGLKHPDTCEWHGIASFRRHGSDYELARLTFRGHVIGGLSRIVTAFMRAAPEKGDLYTYADTRFGSGKAYIQADFEPLGETSGSYAYVNGLGIHNRQSYRKDEMATLLDFFDPEWTEHRLARANGLWRLNGLPQKRFVLRSP